MKRSAHHLVPVLLVASDLLATAAAFLLAYGLRYHTGLGTPRGVASFEDTVAAFGYVILIWVLVFHACGLYQPRHAVSTLEEFYSVALAVTLSCIAFLATAFAVQAFTYSRGVLALAWLTDLVLVTAARTLIRAGLRACWRRGYGLRRVALLGAAEAEARALLSEADYGVTLVATAAPLTEGGGLDRLDWEAIDLLVLTDDVPLEVMRAALDRCERHGVEARLLPGAADLFKRQGALEVVDGIPMVTLAAGPAQLWRRAAKRALDLLSASMLLLLFAVPMLVIALLIRFTSAGPALFCQERVGRNGRRFRMFKFRTIAVDRQGEAVRSGGDHPGLTAVGRWLRRLSLDELPQLFNVLRGEMSLVGPRPEQPQFVEQLSAQVPGYSFRHRVKGGLTGWAQVHDLRSSSSIAERTRYDLYYVEHWTLLLDLKIIVRTAFEFLFHRNAR